MLVLSRKVGDRLPLGLMLPSPLWYLAVLRIGVEAPPHMAIVRDELKEDIEREMNVASQPGNQISS